MATRRSKQRRRAILRSKSGFKAVIRPFCVFLTEIPRTVFRRVCLPGNSILSGTGYSPAIRFWESVRCTPRHAIGFERLLTEERKMKKLVLALTALAAFTGSASAADLAARPYTKAPVPLPVAPNWTGFYIFGGGGGGLWAADSNVVTQPGGAALTRDQRLGGSGWFGTVGAGYDWQFNSSWVAGIFADGQFGDIRGSISDPTSIFPGFEGREKLRTSNRRD